MAQVDSQYIKKGLWVDVDRGPVLGKTITTDTRTGNILVALLAVLSTIGTTHLWHLVTFGVHQVRASGRPTDGLFRQQQALLRTGPPPSAVIADILKLWWAWRAKTKRPLLRSTTLLSMAILFTIATVAASVFSSLVVDSGNLVVLVSSPLCGWVRDEAVNAQRIWKSISPTSSRYAEDCYYDSQNFTNPRNCERYLQAKIPLTTRLVECPFPSKCAHKDAHSMDSGIVEVNKAFGMNLPKANQVRYRKMTTCQILERDSPLAEQEDQAPLQEFVLEPGQNGLVTTQDSTTVSYGAAPASDLVTNVTLQVGLSAYTNLQRVVMRDFVYHSSLNATWNGNAISWAPLPQLRRNDGDTALTVVLIPHIDSYTPINDPVFNGTGSRMRAYGCLQQYQFCHARDSKSEFCTELDGLPAEASRKVFPDANELQLAVLKLLVTSSYLFDRAKGFPTQVNDYIDAGDAQLKPNEFDDVKIAGIPDDQWRRDLTRAEQVIWASLQAYIADYAIGPTLLEGKAADLIPPSTDGEKQLCGVQRVKKSGDVVNVSLFGLVFIITFSCVVAIIDITFLKFLIFLSKFRAALAPRIDRWILDGVWQLQRRAYETQNHHNWSGVEGEIPVYTEEKEFKDLPFLWLPAKDMDEGSTDNIPKRNLNVRTDTEATLTNWI